MAAQYSIEQGGDALLIIKGDRVLFEGYQNDLSETSPHILASGSKSFVGAMALVAVEDDLIELDEKVSETLTEWQADPRKASITVQQLLT